MTENSVLAGAEPTYYTFQEACAVLNVDPQTLRKALDDGRIPYVKVGPKTIRIPTEGLRALWKEQA